MHVQPDFFENDSERCFSELSERDEPILISGIQQAMERLFGRNENEQK